MQHLINFVHAKRSGHDLGSSLISPELSGRRTAREVRDKPEINLTLRITGSSHELLKPLNDHRNRKEADMDVPTPSQELDHAAAHRDYWVDVYAVHSG
jgi:hypothetical protein